MSVGDMFRVGRIKAKLEEAQRECATLRKIVAETDRMDYRQLKAAIAELREQEKKLLTDWKDINAAVSSERAMLDGEMAAKKREIIVLDDEILLQSFGFYKPRYGLENSDAYAAMLEQIRSRQETMVKEGTAAFCPTDWSVNQSKAEGKVVRVA
ncbi:MAG: hypothetical protein ACT4N4_13570 [Rhodospirillales bacterium]